MPIHNDDNNRHPFYVLFLLRKRAKRHITRKARYSSLSWKLGKLINLLWREQSCRNNKWVLNRTQLCVRRALGYQNIRSTFFFWGNWRRLFENGPRESKSYGCQVELLPSRLQIRRKLKRFTKFYCEKIWWQMQRKQKLLVKVPKCRSSNIMHSSLSHCNQLAVYNGCSVLSFIHRMGNVENPCYQKPDRYRCDCLRFGYHLYVLVLYASVKKIPGGDWVRDISGYREPNWLHSSNFTRSPQRNSWRPASRLLRLGREHQLAGAWGAEKSNDKRNWRKLEQCLERHTRTDQFGLSRLHETDGQTACG